MRLRALGLLVNTIGWAPAFGSGAGILLTMLLVPPLLSPIRAEEALLQGEFGGAYEAYRGRRRRLIPRVY